LAPSHIFVGLYLRNYGKYRQSEKNLLNSNISSTWPDNMVNFGLLTAETCWRLWGTPANFNGFRVLAAVLHSTLVVGVSQTLRRWTEGATYIRQGGHHVGHWPTFLHTPNQVSGRRWTISQRLFWFVSLSYEAVIFAIRISEIQMLDSASPLANSVTLKVVASEVRRRSEIVISTSTATYRRKKIEDALHIEDLQGASKPELLPVNKSH